MKPSLSTTFFALALTVSLASCSKSSKSDFEAGHKAGSAPSAASPASTAQASPTSPSGGQPAAHPPAANDLSGTVLETMDSGGYTYMKLRTGSGEVWAAANQTQLKVGDTVTIFNAMAMDGFESPTLKRKFDRIYFGSMAPSEKSPAASAHGEAPTGGKDAPTAPAAHAAAKKDAPDAGPIKVEKASGPEGKTVAELFAQKAALKGKLVAVRGKVVKFLPGIMGKNWVHIQDGTGAKGKKDHDLTVTTQETVAVGTIVLVKGKLDTDKDVGSGYDFPVIIEDAKFSK